MDKFSMAMGITLLNRIALSAMTLAQVVGESKSTTWSISTIMEEGGMGVSQKVENKEKNETNTCVWTSCNPWQCKGRRGPNPLCS
jgi:hypothetical protein